MCKSRIFAEILNIVSTETEVPEECILSSRKDEDTVDARYLLVHFLSKQGFSHSGIAKLINKDVRIVNYIITHFPDREKDRKILGINSENIRKQSGPHFDDKFAKWQVEQMHHKGPDGKVCRGEHWSIEDAEDVFSRNKSRLPAGTTVADVYVAINGNFHDRSDLFKRWNPDKWEEMVVEDAIVFYFLDCDWNGDGKVWDYMNANDGEV